jgi:hypothetical protein
VIGRVIQKMKTKGHPMCIYEGFMLMKVFKCGVTFSAHTWPLLRFGYLGKWSPCVYESLNTKGETITLILYFMILISL